MNKLDKVNTILGIFASIIAIIIGWEEAEPVLISIFSSLIVILFSILVILLFLCLIINSFTFITSFFYIVVCSIILWFTKLENTSLKNNLFNEFIIYLISIIVFLVFLIFIALLELITGQNL
ncbi:MAG: hypothetical protein AB4063_00560 [Crocosphaera sp.]